MGVNFLGPCWNVYTDTHTCTCMYKYTCLFNIGGNLGAFGG